jgi:chorismate mutase/prephenate dehydratase
VYDFGMNDAKQQFDEIRAAVESADLALADALSARASAIAALAELRGRAPDAYFSLPRDSEVIGRIVERVRVFPKDAVRSVMKEVLSACASVVAPLEVVYAGQAGGFGHLAARKHFGATAHLRAVDSAEALLAELDRGHAAFGLLPFETSYDGAVTQTLNLLARSEVKISAEVPIRRAFHLMSKSGKASDVKKIYAAPSALAACEKYLSRRFPQAVLIDTHGHMLAAEHATAEADAAALGTDVAAELAGLTPIESSIEDVADLDTRYVVVGHDFPPRTGSDRTAIAIALHDAPGVLIDCLRPFADRKINLSRLETRPARGWEFRYLILVEVDGHITDRSVLACIEELRAAGRYVKVLGSYPNLKER